MLQGTFETLALPELLGMLAGARKSGALRLEAGPVSAVVYLQDGHCRAVETSGLREPVGSGPALLARLVDVCFTVTREAQGAFRFVADELPPWSCNEPAELSDALVELDRLLKQWRDIVRVIPSLDCRPRLLDALAVDEMVVDRERWALLVAVDGRRSVREIVQRAARSEIEVCQGLLELVDAGAIGMIDPAAAAAPPPPAAAPVAPPAPPPAPVAPPPAPVAPPPAPVAPVAAPPRPPAPETNPPPVPARVVAGPVVVRPAADTRAAANGDGEPDGDKADGDKADGDKANGEKAPGDKGGDGAAAPDKGAFLRMFSGLRES